MECLIYREERFGIQLFFYQEVNVTDETGTSPSVLCWVLDQPEIFQIKRGPVCMRM